ncbi:ubiquitin-like-conjugating enzyme ATG10 isoform X3 [Panicum virgatum]|uniref:ubiquitin-like-conjugating enzyme ATG10 isoform X3 n=1 Tax=Panicum virgatum TaxID=38727 RepID=UPI0019D62B30|nr:ubiquitin-like-conjugating enzyme ATG10 isoform X3 [Panicum virgatum]
MGGSPVWDGTLSLDNFNASAAALVKRWKEIEVDDSLPDWTWKPCSKMGAPSEVEGYLALEGVYRDCGGSQEQIDENDNSDGADVVACDTWGHRSDCQLLTLDEIKHHLPSNSLKVLSESKWTFITREEHPHLSRPWFTLLPCATSDWMKLLLEESNEAIQEQSLRYLSAWLSVAGQAVGLKIPLELHCNS